MAKLTDLNRVQLGVEYRAGTKTLRELGAEFGVSAPRITQIAEEEKWDRDLSERIARKAAAKVNSDALNKELNKKLTKATENEVVEVVATNQANVVLGERKDVVRFRGLLGKLFVELESTTDSLALMEQIGELMASPDEAGIDKLNEAYRKVISLPGRVDMAKKLVETLEKLINAERRVFNIKDDSGDEPKRFIAEVRLVPLMRTIEHD